MAGLRNNPEYWRKRAEDARKRAAQIPNKARKIRLLKLAKMNDQMAEQAEERSRRASNKQSV